MWTVPLIRGVLFCSVWSIWHLNYVWCDHSIRHDEVWGCTAPIKHCVQPDVMRFGRAVKSTNFPSIPRANTGALSDSVQSAKRFQPSASDHGKGLPEGSSQQLSTWQPCFFLTSLAEILFHLCLPSSDIWTSPRRLQREMNQRNQEKELTLSLSLSSFFLRFLSFL